MQVAPTLVPLLKFYFHEEVRKAAISGIYLIEISLVFLSIPPLNLTTIFNGNENVKRMKILYKVQAINIIYAPKTAFCRWSTAQKQHSPTLLLPIGEENPFLLWNENKPARKSHSSSVFTLPTHT